MTRFNNLNYGEYIDRQVASPEPVPNTLNYKVYCLQGFCIEAHPDDNIYSKYCGRYSEWRKDKNIPHYKSVFVFVNFFRIKNETVSMKISGKFPLLSISIIFLSQVFVYLLKIGQMCCLISWDRL